MLTLAPLQESLFDAGSAPCPDQAPVVRHPLDARSWVDTSTGWLRGAGELFEQLVVQVTWEEPLVPMYGNLEVQPRLSAWLADDSFRRFPALALVADVLSRRYRKRFDSVGLNLYRDGRDSVAWHSDRNGRTAFEPIVAIITLGAARPFHLRPKNGGPSHRFRPGSGDLLVMGGACQHRWQHRVPKGSVHQPRLSLSFRHAD